MIGDYHVYQRDLTGLKLMKLLEFFSKNDTEKEAEQMENDVEKDIMGFILDDDDIYKEKLLPRIHKLKSGKEIGAQDFMDIVNDSCIAFYKEEDLKKDPNELFPLAMRKRLAKQLHDINKNSLKPKKKEKDAD